MESDHLPPSTKTQTHKAIPQLSSISFLGANNIYLKADCLYCGQRLTAKHNGEKWIWNHASH